MTSTAPPQSDYERALELFRAGRYDEALPLLQRHALVSPDEATLYGIAICHLRLGDWEAAELALSKLVSEFPDRVEYAEELRVMRRSRDGRAPGHDVSEPTRLGTDTGGASASTLAGLMEDPHGSPGLADYTGEFLFRRGRALLSHRRLWLAMVVLVVDLSFLGWLENQVRQASIGWPDLWETAADLIGILHSLRLVVVLVCLVLVAGALLSSRMTSYTVWTHRLDITTGVLFRRHRTVWFYKVTDVQLVQNPVLLLAGTASLVLFLDEVHPSTPRPPSIVGACPTRAMRRLQDQLLFLVAQERRDMKKQFI